MTSADDVQRTWTMEISCHREMSLLGTSVYANPDTPLWIPIGGVTGPTGATGTTGATGATGPVGVNPGGEAYNVNWTWGDGSSPSYSPLTVTASAVPSPDYFFLQARRSDQYGSTATFYGRFGSGNCFLEYALDGQFYLPLNIRARPLIILGDTTSILQLTDEIGGGSGIFTVDSSNNLYWNGKKVLTE